MIAATNLPLADAVAQGRFRADLFYRLQVLTITLPPLRERRDEIPALADTLPAARRAPERRRRARRSIAYDWPGNVRELKNTLWRAALLAEGAPIAPRAPGAAGGGGRRAVGRARGRGRDARGGGAPRDRRGAAATGGNKVRAAERLGIARSTLLEKLRRAVPTG